MQNIPSERERKALLQKICDALIEKNYDPIRQIRGYLLSDDPTYIPDYKNARAAITEIDREILLDDLLRAYLGISKEDTSAL
jgi:uncharacterized protein (UPF0297 family)